MYDSSVSSQIPDLIDIMVKIFIFDSVTLQTSHSLLRRRSLGSSRNIPPPRILRDKPKERLRRRLSAFIVHH